jgi:MFS family permease
MTNQLITSAQASRVFLLSCVALTVTAMTFGIRAGILGELGIQFGLTNVELGYIVAMAFWGFPLATVFGGVLYNALGAKKLIWLAFVCHLLGLILTIYSQDFWGLMISSFLVGFANGSVEAGCNPVVSDLYPDNKTTMLNKFHVWFPGGIVIGAMVSYFMTQAGFEWTYQIAVMIIPTFIYGALTLKATFPEPDREIMSTRKNIKHLATPLFFFLAAIMTVTATVELGTTQWIQKILGAQDVHPMIIMSMIFVIMAIGRYFAGPLVHKFNPAGVLLYSSIVTTIGLFLLSQSTGHMIYLATIVFALGVTYFWPTMIGCVAEYLPKTGALGMSLVGGAGMVGLGIWNPIIGGWVDAAEAEAIAQGATADVIASVAGPAVLENLTIFPVVLIIAFLGFFLFMKKQGLNLKTNH